MPSEHPRFLILPIRQMVSDLVTDFHELNPTSKEKNDSEWDKLVESIVRQLLDELIDEYIHRYSKYMKPRNFPRLGVERKYDLSDTDQWWAELSARAWDEVYRNMQLLVSEPTWKVIYKKYVGSAAVIELGEDYRVLEWTRRMESGEWHE